MAWASRWAHQHIVQTDKDVFEAVLGNVGSLMVFRVGASDAPTFQRQLGTVAIRDLVNAPSLLVGILAMCLDPP